MKCKDEQKCEATKNAHKTSIKYKILKIKNFRHLLLLKPCPISRYATD